MPHLTRLLVIVTALLAAACAEPVKTTSNRAGPFDRPPVERAPDGPTPEAAAEPATDLPRVADRSPSDDESDTPVEAGPPTEAAAAPPRDLRVNVDDGLVVYVDRHVVEIAAYSCLDAGWLEQVACTPGSREHEALVAVVPAPSAIHAAMLLAGFEHGTPGRWSYDDGEYTLSPPTGDFVEIDVRYDRDGETVTVPIRTWIRDHLGERDFPDRPWIFAGSHFRPNPPGMKAGEHYVADFSGSVIGLVTFGDEVVGFQEVIADQASVQPPEWEVNEPNVPPMGTEVTLIIKSWSTPEAVPGPDGSGD